MATRDRLFELLDVYFQTMRDAWKRQEAYCAESPEFDSIQNELSDALEVQADSIKEHVHNLGRRRFGKQDWEWRYRDADELVESETDSGCRLLSGQIGEFDHAHEDLHSKVARLIASNVHHQLIEWDDTEWVAAVPLEWRFEHFPSFLRLCEGCSIVNAVGDGIHGAHRNRFYDFQRILADNLQVEFQPTTETAKSYLEIGQSLSEECRGYIPGRPLLVFELGKGPRGVASLRLRRKIVVAAPLIRLCQLFCTNDNAIETGTAPDGHRELAPGFAEIPQIALGLVRSRGTAELWHDFHTDLVSDHDQESEAFRDSPSPADFLLSLKDKQSDWPAHELHPTRGWQFNYLDKMLEPSRAFPIDPAQFLASWNSIGAPVLRLRKEGDTLQRTSDDLINGIGDAVRHVARCLYGLGGSLLLNCVEATEWLLNPTGEERTQLAQQFALRASALSSLAGDDQQWRFEQARELYVCRCCEVHEIGAIRRQLPRVYSHRALELFATCLRSIAEWITKTENATPQLLERHLSALAAADPA